MTRRWLQVVPLMALVTLVGCIRAQADEESLRASFAEQIATSDFVTDFTGDGDEFRFFGPDGEDGTTAWRVGIDSSLVEPNESDEAMPYQGRITSEWYANGEIVEYLGTMTALPQEFLDRGLGQECSAYWVEAERRWDW